MAPKRKPKSELSRTAKFYRDNPKSAEKKDKKSKEVNKRPEQIKKRSELSTMRRRLKRKGVDVSGKDLSHQSDGSVKLQNSSKNRGNTKTTKGDRKSRGKK